MVRTSHTSAEGAKSPTIPQANMGHIGAFASCGGLHKRGDRVTVMEKEGQERHFDPTQPPLSALLPSQLCAWNLPFPGWALLKRSL